MWSSGVSRTGTTHATRNARNKLFEMRAVNNLLVLPAVFEIPIDGNDTLNV